MTARQNAKWLEAWAKERLGPHCPVTADLLLKKYGRNARNSRRLDEARARCVANEFDPTYRCWEVDRVLADIEEARATKDRQKLAANDRS
jgi:hypothetical protein